MKLAIAYSLLALAAGACGDNFTGKAGVDAKVSDGNQGTSDAPPDAPAGTTVLRSTLSGFQEVPPVYAAAKGVAVLGVNQEKTAITVELAYTDLTAITAAHIHLGKPGVNGGVIFTLSTGDFASPLVKTLTEADFTAGGGVATFAEAVEAVLAGDTYINIHTTDQMSGAIRGHVGKTTLSAVGSGGQENPAVAGAQSGIATVTLNDEQTAIDVSFDTTGLTDATAAHIHFGAVGHNGPVLFELSGAPVADPIVKTVTEADLTLAPTAIENMRDAVDAVLSGRAYINVHTTAEAGGALRAQLGAVTLRSSLTAEQEVANVNSQAKGRSTITISGDQTTLTTSTQYNGIMATNIAAAHIHAGAFGVNGPPIFTLAAADAASPINKTLTATDLMAGGGVTTMAAAVNALLVGGTYVNVHTTQNANGEIRGQVGRVVFTSTLNGANERPPVVTLATGTATITVSGSQREIVVAGTYNGLSNISGAHIHLGPTNMSGPVLFPLASAAFNSPFSFVAASDALMATAGAMNMAEAIGQLFDENTYINIHTSAAPDGEIRGQIVVP